MYPMYQHCVSIPIADSVADCSIDTSTPSITIYDDFALWTSQTLQRQECCGEQIHMSWLGDPHPRR